MLEISDIFNGGKNENNLKRLLHIKISNQLEIIV